MSRFWKPVILLLMLAAGLQGPIQPTHSGSTADSAVTIGREVAIPRHLQDGEETSMPLPALIDHGRQLFQAQWTIQEGGGRPLTKGTGQPLADPTDPLVFPRNFNRISAPDSNSCAGCHNMPFGIPGGSGDFVTSVFVLGQRFDFATFDHNDPIPTKGAKDEASTNTTLQTIANRRATIGMFGAGYIEMLARQITAELQQLRDSTPPGGTTPLIAKGISFGVLARDASGNWLTGGVEGLPAPSLATTGPDDPPSLIIRPFHQAGAVISLREFTNNAFNHHLGIQSTERFGQDTDPDGDGFTNEMTRADVTAATIFQATLPVPGRVIPNDTIIEQAVQIGETRFTEIGCADCHVPRLPLDNAGWLFVEPNPYNPPGNLQPGQADPLFVDLNDDRLPQPRLHPEADAVVYVPAFTDFKLHDITSGPDDPNGEPLDMLQPAGSPGFFAGNRRFLTARLWGVANQPPYFHHGQFTTMRQAILAHAGEAEASRQAFEALPPYEQDSLIEFLKTLQVLPPDTPYLTIDETGRPKAWPTPAYGSLEGAAYLQGRVTHHQIKISADGIGTQTTSDGKFRLYQVPAGRRTLRADYERYLPAEKPDVKVIGGNPAVLPHVQLRGGDTNSDNRIDLWDLVLVGLNFGSSPPTDPRCDINANSACDIFDLVMVGSNYGLEGPTPWTMKEPAVASQPAGTAAVDIAARPVPADSIKPSDTQIFEVWIKGVSNLYGADIQLAFDPAHMQVLDEDPATGGVQIRPALNEQTSFVALATADNQRGSIRLAFTLKRPATPLQGGIRLAQIRFQPLDPAPDPMDLAKAGSPVQLVTVQLADPEGRPIPVHWASLTPGN